MDAMVLHADPSKPRNTFSLNGMWEIQPGGAEPPVAEWNHRVPVPGLVDLAAPSYDWRQNQYHWYRIRFRMDPAAEFPIVLLILEQAMFGTEVWMNGRHIGGDIGCYTSQEYEVTSAIRTNGENELLVRVGAKNTLPPESAVGKDQERTEWIPGIWGDVSLVQCGNPRVKLVQVIPHIHTATAEVRVTVENLSNKPHTISLHLSISERVSRKEAGHARQASCTIAPSSSQTCVFDIRITDMQLWSPEQPFLYDVETKVAVANTETDAAWTTFGMREFTIVDGDFHFNGKKIFLRGGNIAFHRFLSDAERDSLPWNPEWIKKVLIDIPKEHNFNFFRAHIGQMYNRWYAIADEYGMLLQNEWMFWTTSGTKQQITKEFTRWLQDNWNHPSIIIWDALNECTDDVVQKEIVPEMKRLDPTRPWESVDFTEDHPYIYSLGPVLNDRTFGFTRSLEEIERSPKPSVLNEFCWWWLDKDFNPTSLMKDVVERWLGPHWTKEQLIAHQSFLVTELVELFRRMRVDAIQPFVYLSNNAGPTANWFLGNIKDLQPKPILATLKNAFSPFGISIELWDRHFFRSEQRRLRLFVFNDRQESQEGLLRYGIVNCDGVWFFDTRQRIHVPPTDTVIVPMTVPCPAYPGDYTLCAELYQESVLVASSKKPAFVCAPIQVPRLLQERVFALPADADDELKTFLERHGLRLCALAEMQSKQASALIVDGGMLNSTAYQSRLGAVSKFLESGKTLVVLEPEYGVTESETVSVALGLDLTITKREDKDKGGYDSYVFATDESHPIWEGIPADHLKMFNGAYGGEVVSQHDVHVNRESHVLARCGLGLGIPAVFEIPYGRGKVIVSRLQLRGRLVASEETTRLYARRPDPVLQRYLLNLLSTISND